VFGVPCADFYVGFVIVAIVLAVQIKADDAVTGLRPSIEQYNEQHGWFVGRRHCFASARRSASVIVRPRTCVRPRACARVSRSPAQRCRSGLRPGSVPADNTEKESPGKRGFRSPSLLRCDKSRPEDSTLPFEGLKAIEEP
jgi:hypothetical protein